MNMKKTSFILAAAVMGVCASAQAPAYKNKALSPEARTADLIKRMTVEEKITQT
jgi:beta-glucosidase